MAPNRHIPIKLLGQIPLQSDQFDLEMVFSGNTGKDSQEDAENIIQTWVDAGEARMFCVANQADQESYLSLISPKKITKAGINFVSRAKLVDISAYRLLLNMVIQINGLNQHWQSFQITPLTLTTPVMTLSQLLNQSLPIFSPSLTLPFQLLTEEWGSQAYTHTVRIEFANKLTRNAFDEIGPVLENWCYLVMFGAYLQEIEIMEEFSLNPDSIQIHMIDPYTIEQIIDVSQELSQSAFQALINFIVKLHLTFQPVNILEII